MKFTGETPSQKAALETNYGLTEPGECDTCKQYGPRNQFYNEYTCTHVIDYKLCPRCTLKAMKCVELCLRLRKD